MRRGMVAALLALATSACATLPDRAAELDEIEGVLGRHIATLASEGYGGRKPGTLGGLRTRAYIAGELATYGFLPGAGDDQWEQKVVIRPRRDAANGEGEDSEADTITANVVGVLRGTEEGSGAVLLMGHWDHLGECVREGADRICNGAIDNASGIGAMLEVARRLAEQGPQPRDIYILATTSEEEGLLGATAFADDPPVPLPTIVAAFNFDSSAIAPRGSPVAVIGWGRTALDRHIAKVASGMGRPVRIRAAQERWLARQDGWALLQRDVPSVLVSSTFADEARLQAFVDNAYHAPADDWGPQVELGGAAEDVLLHVALAMHFANPVAFPVGAEAPAPAAEEPVED